MALEDSSMWVRIFEGVLSGENFKITEDNRPQVVIPINVFSYYYKIKVETEQAKPWWWLAGSLIERVGTSSEIDRLEVNRYIVPSNREILLRPTFNNRAFYYIFEPAYWHTKIFVQLWVYIDDPENVQYVNFLDVKEPHETDIWTSLANKDYVTQLFASHLELSNPHGITPEKIGAVTQQEINEAIAAHLNSIDPHPQYLTQQRGNNLYAANGSVEGAIASHLAATNPHQITPNLIGAAATSHTHLGSQVTGNIPGNAANVTGIVAIENGGTNSTTVSEAQFRLGVDTNLYTVTFANGWSEYAPSAWKVNVQKFGRLKIINGLVTRVVGNSSSHILTLPFSSWPENNQAIMSCVWGFWNVSYQIARVDVYPDGTIFLVHPNPGSLEISWLQLHFCYI